MAWGVVYWRIEVKMNSKIGRFQETGVVEGFYGRVWDAPERERFIAALLPFGLNTYLFCPKNEPALAADLMRELSAEEGHRLGKLAAFCDARIIALWAGLHLEPPLNTADPGHLDAVARKCRDLNRVGFSGFVLQFDDLSTVTCPVGPVQGSLATQQGQAVEVIRQRAGFHGVQACWGTVPGLYTLDPDLEKAFGPFEPDYLRRLDACMSPEIAMIWTGPRVCSPTVTLSHLNAWRKESQRDVLLWDNHPVNDAEMSNNLHLSPLTGRAPDLPRGIRGYLFNPLLQPALGVVPGATCLAYANDPGGYYPVRAWRAALEANLPESARGAFSELEALTRRCSLAEFLPDESYPGSEPLAARLHEAWAAARNGNPLDPAPAAELGGVLALLNAELPAEMRREAAPWLERLSRARNLFAAGQAEAGPGREPCEAVATYRQGTAMVLGEWFSP